MGETDGCSVPARAGVARAGGDKVCRVFKTIAPSHRVQEMPDAVLRPWVCVTPRERSFVGLQEDRPGYPRRGGRPVAAVRGRQGRV